MGKEKHIPMTKKNIPPMRNVLCCIALLLSPYFFGQITTLGDSKIFVGKGAAVFADNSEAVINLSEEAIVLQSPRKIEAEDKIISKRSKPAKASALAASVSKKTKKASRAIANRQQGDAKLRSSPAGESCSSVGGNYVCFVAPQFRYAAKQHIHKEGGGLSAGFAWRQPKEGAYAPPAKASSIHPQENRLPRPPPFCRYS